MNVILKNDGDTIHVCVIIVLYEIISREDSREITCDMRNHTIANISGSHIHQAKNDRHNQCV